ncbi:MAG: ROK family transcriptional regulator [bacterium]|nr:ROK family transcriptional regulator [bacterium]
MILHQQNSSQLHILNLLRLRPGISRVEIVELTGLGKATVSTIISGFINEGIAFEEGTGEQLGPAGRRPVKLKLNEQLCLSVGVELTGSECIATLTDLYSEPLRVVRHPMPNVSVEASVAVIIKAISELVDGYDLSKVLGVGVGVPGPVDVTRQRVIQAENLDWFDVPLGSLLTKELDKPVLIVKRQNAGALGEYRYGIGKNTDNLLYISIGIGIGGGIITNGKLYEGHGGGACEIGHMTIVPDGYRCKCGNSGCLETVASCPAIAVRAKEQIRTGRETMLIDRTSSLPQPITIVAIIQAAQQGDALAIEVIREAAGYMGSAVANVVNLLNPAMVIFGGELAALGDLFFEPIRETVRSHAFPISLTDLQIVPGALGPRAAAIGAAALIIDRLFSPDA